MTIDKSLCYCSVKLHYKDQSIETLENCYYKRNYIYAKNKHGEKVMSFFKSIILKNKNREIHNENIDEIYITDIYYYDEHDEKINISKDLIKEFIKVCELYSNQLEFPVPKAVEYID